MEETTVDLRLTLYVQGESLRGQLQDGDDEARTFTGWLGFVSVLDALIAEATANTKARNPGGTR